MGDRRWVTPQGKKRYLSQESVSEILRVWERDEMRWHEAIFENSLSVS